MSATIQFRPNQPSWLSQCHSTKSGPIPNLHNALLALRLDPHWAGKFRFNQMLRSVVTPELPLADIDTERAMEWLQANGLRRCGLDTVRTAINLVGHDHPFHPIRDWLNSLVWDGNLRLTDWLSQFLGADDNEYHKQASHLFLTQMVARIFEPGCKADYSLVLEGPQRLEKSRACAALAGDDQYFSDHLPDLSADKDTAAHLAGKWLIEISELSAFQRADNEKLKAFLTRRVERYRPAYGRQEVYEPRQCVFIGTTNKFVWMKDETGGRRFWPVRCGAINVDGLTAAREQLLAEAVDFYRTKQRWWPESDIETALFEPQQAARFEDDAWETSITDWDFTDADRDANGRPLYVTMLDSYGNPRRTDTPLRHPLTAPYHLADIASGALAIPKERLNVADQRRLVRALEHLQWSRAPRDKRGIPWQPPVAP